MIKNRLITGIKSLSHKINSYDKNLVINLVYHRILKENPKYDYFGTVVLEDTFYSQIKFLAKKYECILSNPQDKNKIKFLLTFDDGFLDNFLIALPILKKFNLKAIFFIPTKFIDTKDLIWDYNLFLSLLNHQKELKFEIDNKIQTFDRIEDDYSSYIKRFIIYLKNQKFNKFKKILNYLNFNYQNNFKYNEFDRCLRSDEIEEMSKNGMLFGSHSENHFNLSKMNNDMVFQEISQSKEKIESITKKICKYIAVPFGSKSDYNNEILKIIRNYKYEKCFLNTHGLGSKKNFVQKRIIMHEKTDLKTIMNSISP